MKTRTMGLGVTLLAVLTLAGGSSSLAQADNGYEDGPRHKGGHEIVVKGDHNQVVVGNENVVGRGDVSNNIGPGEGDEAVSAPNEPYATVHRNVTYLAERAAPRTTSAEVARFGPDTQVPLSCYVTGEDVHGNRTWYRVRQENEFKTGYISAYYATLKGAINRCS